MNPYSVFKGAAAVVAALVVALAMTACKGRTMENMVPDGDTVEVMPDTITPDSVAAPQL